MSSIPITVHGQKLLLEELELLKNVERPAVIVAISEARAQGDLSENAEYDAAKERQGFVEGRIAEIEGKLSQATIIDPSTLEQNGRVVFGVTVKVEDLDSEDIHHYQIVGEDEANFREGKVSYNSPVARSLIGKRVGDVVEVPVGDRVRELEVLEVIYG